MADAQFKVTIDGKDITSALEPVVSAISIKDSSGAASDTADITLDDEGGRIKLPRKGVGIEISLSTADGLVAAFKGTVDAVRSRGGRGGAELSITAKGADVTGGLKELRSRHWDDAKLGAVLDQAARDAGLEGATVDEKFAAQARDYVAQQGESFMAFGQRLAREVGGTFKIAGKKAYLIQRGGGVNARGKALATVTAEYGVNLIDWDIAPDVGRTAYGSAGVRVYDPDTGGWTTHTATAKTKRSSAKHKSRFPAGSASAAAGRAEADAGEVVRHGGSGTVNVLCDPRAKPEGQCVIKGARAGIDGTYRITSVGHAYTRGQGTETSLELGEPSGTAGVDDR
ncbi:phage late control D family protein [Caulobacter sp. RL271]|uniref:Contractile injection system protein, VgrG/Pvc8 family n=1 Tax=Caulobacter segnis TaxID=88688 RepID=A0ABY4ZX07_9CAUL|nr:contractile injection system protein, VgrG/Pvc8 family [Caulobacter segnis]USQ97233.1 contractile injection system protein, VgrG/Pvc8 family [Caulobacter segnis]